MFAKCAAWPASCMSVVSAVTPRADRGRVGEAREVGRRRHPARERVVARGEPRVEAVVVVRGRAGGGRLDPRARGQWQKPFEYLPGRSSRSSVIVAR